MLDNAKTFLKDNAPTILTCLGAIGVVATTVLAVKATPKAVEGLKEAQKEKDEELTNIEVIKTTAPVYIPTIIMCTATISCIVGANILNKRQQAALASAYALVSTSYQDYRNKVIELYGEDKNEEVNREIVKDKHKETDIVVHDDKQLFYDAFSRQYFESTLFKVQQAEYLINRDLTMRDYAYVNEFYEYLGIDTIESGWKLGWSVGACLASYWQPWIDFHHKKVIMDDGLECTIITMFQEPFADFENYA